MATVIRSLDTHLVENRRNRFKEPWPSTTAMFPSAVGAVSFITPGTRAAMGVITLPTGGGTYFILTTAANRIAVVPGETIEYVADTQGPGGVARRLRLYFMDALGASLPGSTESLPETATWVTTQSVSAVAPQSAVFAGIYLLLAGTAPNNSDLKIRKVQAGLPGGYIDGAMPPVGDRSYTWAGPANKSESIEWLRTPVVNVLPLVVDGFEAARTPGTLLHPVLGRSDPDVTFRPAGLRAGTLTLIMPDSATAHAAFAGLLTPRVFELADTDLPELAMRFVVADDDIGLALEDVNRKRWVLTVPFREVTL